MVFVLPLQLFLSTSLEFNYGFCVPLQKRSCASHLSLSRPELINLDILVQHKTLKFVMYHWF